MPFDFSIQDYDDQYKDALMDISLPRDRQYADIHLVLPYIGFQYLCMINRDTA